jgi:hypothetical protein
MLRYNLHSHTKTQNASEKNPISESISQKMSGKFFSAQPLGLPVPDHLLPPLEEEPNLRPTELSETHEPLTGYPIIDLDSDLTSPLDVERPNPLTSISPDDSDASILNKDPLSASNTSPEYIGILKSLRTLSLSPNEQMKIGTEFYHMALYAINPVDDDDEDASNRNTLQFDNAKVTCTMNPSSFKDMGKNVNPHNCGNLEIPEYKLDLNAQQQVLEEARCLLNQKQNNPKATSTPRSVHELSRMGSEKDTKCHLISANPAGDKNPSGQAIGISKFIHDNYDQNQDKTPTINPSSKTNGITKPIDLVNLESYLGVAFKELRQKPVPSDKPVKKSAHKWKGRKKSKLKLRRSS